jgi:hypothetical protein
MSHWLNDRSVQELEEFAQWLEREQGLLLKPEDPQVLSNLAQLEDDARHVRACLTMLELMPSPSERRSLGALWGVCGSVVVRQIAYAMLSGDYSALRETERV